jgi:PAS domain S-box-containing protein
MTPTDDGNRLEQRRILRRRAEDRIRQDSAAPGKGDGLLAPEGDRERLIHDLLVHQVELEMQNDELLRTHRELEASRARYMDLYDFSPVAYLTVDESGTILEGNLTAATLLGVDRAELVRRPLTAFILPESQDDYYLQRKELFGTGTPQSCELWMVRAEGVPFCAHLSSIVARADDGSKHGRLVVTDVTERKRMERLLRASLADKDVLLRELSHRTKNNLQIIASMIRLQESASADRKFAEAVADTQDRIRAMALVQENLYRSGNIASMGMRRYLEDLLAAILHAHQGSAGAVECHLDVDDLHLPVDGAVPFGLIINELVSNSLKHAGSPGKAGSIHLEMRRYGEGAELRYRDGGPGLPRGLDLERLPSLGLKLVHSLAVRQLRGTLDIRHDPPWEIVVRVPGFAHLVKD